MNAGGFVPRVLGLTVVHVIAWIVGSAVFPVALPEGVQPDPAGALGAMAIVCLVHAALLGGLVRSSGARGWPLWTALFLIFWGPATLMSQIEVAFFAPPVMQPGTALRVFGMGTVTALVTVPVAILLFRRDRAHTKPAPLDHGVLRVLAGALAYPPIYLVFGYYVALRQPAIQDYYRIEDPGSFLAQLRALLTDNPGLFPFQVFRGLLWVGLTWPMARQLRGSLATRSVWLGLALATFMNAQHLLPNALMPRAVSNIHFIETWPSNFLYGVLLGVLLLWTPRTRGSGRPTG